MRRSIASLFVLLLVGCTSAPPPKTPPPSDTGSEVHAEEINYGPAKGYLALPEGRGPHPALILIHEWWGLNDNIRWYTEEFAKQGYVALAVDLYGGESTDDPKIAQELATAVRGNLEGAFANLRAAISYLRSRPEVVSDRLASVGWCFGGGWSYQIAKNDLGVKASVMYYGQFAPEDDLSMMKAHIIGHFGANDQSIPVSDVKAFRAKLQTLSGEHQIFIYENEGHGFARELLTVSAKKEWERTLAFLREQL